MTQPSELENAVERVAYMSGAPEECWTAGPQEQGAVGVVVRCADLTTILDALAVRGESPDDRSSETTWELRDVIAAAYEQGCHDVHNNYQPEIDPEFGEAASDYAASVTRRLVEGEGS